MPNAPKTPTRNLRIPKEDWDEFADAVADAEGVKDRADAVRQFMYWFMRRPGAKLPKRPDQKEPTT